MYLECPICDTATCIEYEDVPERACDDTEWECPNCKSKMLVGWYAEVEVRGNIRQVQETSND